MSMLPDDGCRGGRASHVVASPPCAFCCCSAQYDADQLPEAKRTLTKALHLAPTDHQLRFNVALTLQVGHFSMAGDGQTVNCFRVVRHDLVFGGFAQSTICPFTGCHNPSRALPLLLTGVGSTHAAAGQGG